MPDSVIHRSRWGACVCCLLVAWALPSCSPRGDGPANSPSGQPAGALRRLSEVDDPAGLGVGQRVALEGPWRAVDGRAVDLPALVARSKATALFVTSLGCPVSSKYAARIAALERQYEPKGASFVLFNPIASDREHDMKVAAAKLRYRGPYLADPGGSLARALGARTTTEVFVLDARGVMRYRGAIDDQFGVGETLGAPRERFLADALDALIAGREVETPATWAAGCVLDAPAEGSGASAREEAMPTYNGSISRILAQSCTLCHRTGGVAPFTLTSLASLEGRASMVEGVVRDGLMPPSHGGPGEGEGPFKGPVGLTRQDRAALLRWLEGGRPAGEGEPARPGGARPVGWLIGRVDSLLVTPAIKLDAEGPLVHSRAILPIRLDESEWVTAVEMKPVKPGSIENALVWVLPPGVEPPGEDEVPGVGSGASFLGAYGAGAIPIEFGEGLSPRVEPGARLLVDAYARPMGQEASVSLRLALQYRRGAVPATGWNEPVRGVTLLGEDLALAAGSRDVEVRGEILLERASRLVAMTPAMRARGTAMWVEVQEPGQPSRRVLTLPRFDSRWGIRYEWAEPLVVAAGSKLRVVGRFDHSTSNPSNPDPRAVVRGGPGAEDEILLVGVEVQAIE